MFSYRETCGTGKGGGLSSAFIGARAGGKTPVTTRMLSVRSDRAGQQDRQDVKTDTLGSRSSPRTTKECAQSPSRHIPDIQAKPVSLTLLFFIFCCNFKSYIL